MDPIYHITTPPAWQEAQAAGVYRADSLAVDGFIHASTVDQLVGSANRFFATRSSVLLLKIDPARVEADLRWESSPHSAQPFPHIYGPLNLGAVLAVIRWTQDDAGGFRMPRDVGSTSD